MFNNVCLDKTPNTVRFIGIQLAQFKEHREKNFHQVQSLPVILNRSLWQVEFFMTENAKKIISLDIGNHTLVM